MAYKEHKEKCALRSFIDRSPLLRKDRYKQVFYKINF